MIDESMEGWALVVTNGVRLVGRRTSQIWKTDTPRMLSPVYELRAVSLMQPAMGRQPPAMLYGGDAVSPPLGFDSLESLEIPGGALVVPVSALGTTERAALAKGIDEYDRARSQRRSGLVVASADALNGQAAKLRVPG